jgi:hypothetical protein
MKKDIAKQLHPVPKGYRWRITDKTYYGDYKVELQRMKMPFWWKTVAAQSMREQQLPRLEAFTKGIWDNYEHFAKNEADRLALKKAVTGVTKR